MKRIVFFLSLVLIFGACKKQSMTLSPKYISMYVGEKKWLHVHYETGRLEHQFVSSDENIVIVEKDGSLQGKVQSISIGNATIRCVTESGYSDICNVTVLPREKIYTAPFYKGNWRCDKNRIRSVEFRTIITETANAMSYCGEFSSVLMVNYVFEQDHLTSCGVHLDASMISTSSLLTYLYERYEYLGNPQEYRYFFMDRYDKSSIVLDQNSSYGLSIVYLPYSGKQIESKRHNLNSPTIDVDLKYIEDELNKYYKLFQQK
jgi:hypothetical protein